MNRYFVYARIRMNVEAKDEQEAVKKAEELGIIAKGAELRNKGGELKVYLIEA